MAIWDDPIGTIERTVKDPVTAVATMINPSYGLQYGGYKALTDQGEPVADTTNEDYQNNVSRGIEEGKGKAQEIYGQNTAQTGAGVQDVIKRRRAALDGKDPASSQLREARNREIAMARARGASEGQLAQVSRDAETQIGRQAFQRQDQTLSDYQKLIGNVLSGQQGMELGYGSLRGSGTAVQTPNLGQGAFGMSVICTQLYHDGYLTSDVAWRDQQYGIMLRMHDPHVYQGYILWAPTVVRWMQASALVTQLVAVPAVAWARHIADDPNWLGWVIKTIGEPICRFIGRTCGRKVQST